jgi:hypothetical protein
MHYWVANSIPFYGVDFVMKCTRRHKWGKRLDFPVFYAFHRRTENHLLDQKFVGKINRQFQALTFYNLVFYHLLLRRFPQRVTYGGPNVIRLEAILIPIHSFLSRGTFF